MEYERIILRREDIKKEAAKAAEKIRGNAISTYLKEGLPHLDEKIVLEASNDIFEQVKQAVKVKQKSHQDQVEYYIICQMALRYLDLMEEKRKETTVDKAVIEYCQHDAAATVDCYQANAYSFSDIDNYDPVASGLNASLKEWTAEVDRSILGN